MFKLASHNSWSFARPVKWYIPRFLVRCQSLNIQQQYEKGVRLFDLRLRYVPQNDFFEPAHGSCFFKTNYCEDLLFLNKLAETEQIYVRVTLEYNRRPDNAQRIIHEFCHYCTTLLLCYNHIRFFGGRAKWSWTTHYHFCYPEPQLLDLYSSTTSWFHSKSRLLRIIDDGWPWLYAHFHNIDNYHAYLLAYGEDDENTTPWFFIDFVDHLPSA